MLPVDSATGKPWESANATRMVQSIRAKANDDLNANDERRSDGRLCAENEYSTLPPFNEDIKGPQRVEPIAELVALKHTGHDTDALTAKRWAEFCKEPQDQVASMATLEGDSRTQRIERDIADGDELEREVAGEHCSKPIKARRQRTRLAPPRL